MPALIIHHEGIYNIYSTITDGCYWDRGISRNELEEWYQRQYGDSGMRELPYRLDRAHQLGCSGFSHSLEDCIRAHKPRMSRKTFFTRYLTVKEEAH